MSTQDAQVGIIPVDLTVAFGMDFEEAGSYDIQNIGDHAVELIEEINSPDIEARRGFVLGFGAANPDKWINHKQPRQDVPSIFDPSLALEATGSGSGSGLVIDSFTVNADGEITSINFSSGGTGFAAGAFLTFSQGNITGTYILVAADISGGAVQNLTGLSIAGQGDYRLWGFCRPTGINDNPVSTVVTN